MDKSTVSPTLVAVGIGLVAAILFFIYLFLFLKIRDEHKGKPTPWLIYFVLAFTFVLIGKFLGVGVTLGVIPMLILMCLIPKCEIAPVVVCAGLYGAVIAGIMLSSDSTPGIKDNELRRIVEAIPGSIIIPEVHSKAIDPEMEFDKIENLSLGGISIRIPIPKGFHHSFATSQESSIQKIIINFGNDVDTKFSGVLTDEFIDVAPNDRLNRTGYTLFRYTSSDSDNYVKQLLDFYESINANATLIMKPVFEQNTKLSVVAYTFFNVEMNDKSFKQGYTEGIVILSGKVFQLITFNNGGDDAEKSKKFTLTWINRLLGENSFANH